MTLNEVKPGHGGIIIAVGGEGALRRRLLDMGLTPRTKVQVRKVAPMGDPIELVLRGYVLTLRGDDAAKIEVSTEEELQGKGSCPTCSGTTAPKPRFGRKKS